MLAHGNFIPFTDPLTPFSYRTFPIVLPLSRGGTKPTVDVCSTSLHVGKVETCSFLHIRPPIRYPRLNEIPHCVRAFDHLFDTNRYALSRRCSTQGQHPFPSISTQIEGCTAPPVPPSQSREKKHHSSKPFPFVSPGPSYFILFQVVKS